MNAAICAGGGLHAAICSLRLSGAGFLRRESHGHLYTILSTMINSCRLVMMRNDHSRPPTSQLRERDVTSYVRLSSVPGRRASKTQLALKLLTTGKIEALLDHPAPVNAHPT
jgi:hypothetical protein